MNKVPWPAICLMLTLLVIALGVGLLTAPRIDPREDLSELERDLREHQDHRDAAYWRNYCQTLTTEQQLELRMKHSDAVTRIHHFWAGLAAVRIKEFKELHGIPE